LEAQAGVWAPPNTSDPCRVITFAQFRAETTAVSTKIQATLAAAKKLIQELGKGQHKLATAPAEKASAVEILTAATNILEAINKVREAHAPDSEQK